MANYLKRELHSRCVGSHATMCNHTVGACSPETILTKMVWSGAIWASQSMLLPTQNSTILRIRNQQHNLIAIFRS